MAIRIEQEREELLCQGGDLAVALSGRKKDNKRWLLNMAHDLLIRCRVRWTGIEEFNVATFAELYVKFVWYGRKAKRVRYSFLLANWIWYAWVANVKWYRDLRLCPGQQHAYAHFRWLMHKWSVFSIWFTWKWDKEVINYDVSVLVQNYT